MTKLREFQTAKEFLKLTRRQSIHSNPDTADGPALASRSLVDQSEPALDMGSLDEAKCCLERHTSERVSATRIYSTGTFSQKSQLKVVKTVDINGSLVGCMAAAPSLKHRGRRVNWLELQNFICWRSMFSQKVLTREFLLQGRDMSRAETLQRTAARVCKQLSAAVILQGFLYNTLALTCHRPPGAASSDKPGGSCDPLLPPDPKEGRTCLPTTPAFLRLGISWQIRKQSRIFGGNVEENSWIIFAAIKLDHCDPD